MVVNIQPAGVTLYTLTRRADTVDTRVGAGNPVPRQGFRSQGSQPVTATFLQQPLAATTTDNQDALTISR